MLLARKNLIFEAIGQLNESNAPPMPSEDRHPGLAVFVCVCVSLSLCLVECIWRPFLQVTSNTNGTELINFLLQELPSPSQILGSSLPVKGEEVGEMWQWTMGQKRTCGHPNIRMHGTCTFRPSTEMAMAGGRGGTPKVKETRL